MAKTNKFPVDPLDDPESDNKGGKPSKFYIGFYKGNKKGSWSLFPKKFQDEKQGHAAIKREVNAEAVKIIPVDLS